MSARFHHTHSSDDDHQDRAPARCRARPRQSAASPIDEEDRQRDEAALAERAGDGPRLDAAADVDLQRDHQQRQERDAARVAAAAAARRTRSVRRSPRSASGVQKKNPCSGENSTSSACGALQVILRVTSRDGPDVRSARVGDELRQERRSRTPGSPRRRSPAIARRAVDPRRRLRSDRRWAIEIQRRAQPRRTRPARAPSPSAPPPARARPRRRCVQVAPHVQPDRDEQRDRERRTGVRHRRRDVHVEEQRRSDPDEQRRPAPLARVRRLRDARIGRALDRPVRSRLVAPRRSRAARRGSRRTPIRTRPRRRTAARSRRPRRRVRRARSARAVTSPTA